MKKINKLENAENAMETKYISLKQVCEITSLGRSTIYNRINEGAFPKHIKISKRRVAWKQQDILDHMEQLNNKEVINDV